MEQQILVRNGLMATEYLLTDRYFKPDPELHLEPLHGDAAVRMSPYTEGFFTIAMIALIIQNTIGIF